MAYSLNMGVREIREGLAAQEFSAREIAQANLEHIAKADEAVHAYLELTEDMAYDVFFQDAGELCFSLYRNMRRALHRSWRHSAGQTEHGRIRVRLFHRDLRVRVYEKPVGSRARPRRFFGRQRRIGRCGHGVHDAR